MEGRDVAWNIDMVGQSKKLSIGKLYHSFTIFGHGAISSPGLIEIQESDSIFVVAFHGHFPLAQFDFRGKQPPNFHGVQVPNRKRFFHFR